MCEKGNVFNILLGGTMNNYTNILKKLIYPKMRYDLLGGWGLRQRGYRLVKKKNNNNNHHHQLNAYYELHNVLADLNTLT